ncbi:MAG: hypothetical protein Q4C86_10560 [bacterium]|nr:hypothetical protein [bacterium]
MARFHSTERAIFGKIAAYDLDRRPGASGAKVQLFSADPAGLSTAGNAILPHSKSKNIPSSIDRFSALIAVINNFLCHKYRYLSFVQFD